MDRGDKNSIRNFIVNDEQFFKKVIEYLASSNTFYHPEYFSNSRNDLREGIRVQNHQFAYTIGFDIQGLLRVELDYTSKDGKRYSMLFNNKGALAHIRGCPVRDIENLEIFCREIKLFTNTVYSESSSIQP